MNDDQTTMVTYSISICICTFDTCIVKSIYLLAILFLGLCNSSWDKLLRKGILRWFGLRVLEGEIIEGCFYGDFDTRHFSGQPTKSLGCHELYFIWISFIGKTCGKFIHLIPLNSSNVFFPSHRLNLQICNSATLEIFGQYNTTQ